MVNFWTPPSKFFSISCSFGENLTKSYVDTFPPPQGCACFPEFLQNFSERQILWHLYLVVFLALTLKLPIQTSISLTPKILVSLRSGQKCQNFRKTSTPRRVGASTSGKSWIRHWYVPTCFHHSKKTVVGAEVPGNVTVAFEVEGHGVACAVVRGWYFGGPGTQFSKDRVCDIFTCVQKYNKIIMF